jgi:hypothetical protein
MSIGYMTLRVKATCPGCGNVSESAIDYRSPDSKSRPFHYTVCRVCGKISVATIRGESAVVRDLSRSEIIEMRNASMASTMKDFHDRAVRRYWG